MRSLLRAIPVLFILSALAVGPRTVLAQDNPVLPDLAPREVEIRGELSIRFPSLRRQPLVGFNPPPRIPEISPSRRPFAEPYKQRRADLPRSPLQDPKSPPVNAYASGPRFDGSIEAGAGRYSERYVRLDAAGGSARETQWTMTGKYDGRSGYAPFTAAPDAQAAFNQGELDASVRIPLGGVHLDAKARGFVERYALYGAFPATLAGGIDAPDRDGNGGGLAVGLERTTGTARFRIEAAVGASLFETSAFDPAIRVDSRTEQSEGWHRLSARLDLGRATIRPWLDAETGSTALGEAPFSEGDARHFSGGAGATIEMSPGARLRLGGRVISYEAFDEATGSGRRVNSWLSPDVALDVAVTEDIRVSATNTPSAGAARLDELYAQHPFIVDSPVLLPELWPVDAAIRGTASIGRLRLAISAAHRQSPNRRYFEHSPQNFLGYPRGISVVAYGKARETIGGLDAGIYLAPTVELRAGFTVQDGRLVDLDKDIPYFAPWTTNVMISVGVLDGKGLIQAIGRVEGPRKRDVAGSAELPTYGDLDLRGSYRITRDASLVLQLRNMAGNRPEWDRYFRPPVIITAGLMWQW